MKKTDQEIAPVETIPLEIPPFEVTAARHPKAVCRWCGEHFMPVWQDEKSQQWQWLCPTPACSTRQLQWAMRDPRRARYSYIPTPAGVELHACRKPKLLWGGSANAAKSFHLRHDLYYWCERIEGLECLLMRRTFPELESTHLIRMQRELDPDRGTMRGWRYMKGDKMAHCERTGSFIRAGHCESVSDLSKILSTDYDKVNLDEGVTFMPTMTVELMSRARSVKPAVHELMGCAHGRIGSNPGGVGHAYLKSAYIDRDLDREEYPDYDPSLYEFIPASLADNPYADPNYEQELRQMTRARRDQLLSGDWNTHVGQFFPMHSSEHIVQ